ncbi:hypothetical protein [Deinococcus fonticola]|uniref:hypothetical protein n=1 Tax=Deinococcus fonticola TaxID=2528713 RepID=UPI00142FB006|nr:hypothetical protein [Deinococcus fonticola]
MIAVIRELLQRLLLIYGVGGEQPTGWWFSGDMVVPYWGPRRKGDGMMPEVTE